jgi:hypothetical protein
MHLAFSVPSDGLCRFRRELERVVPTDLLPVVRFNRRSHGGRSCLVEANIRFLTRKLRVVGPYPISRFADGLNRMRKKVAPLGQIWGKIRSA